MKRIFFITSALLLNSIIVFGQWSGTNPENLNGSATLTGNLTVGSAFVPSAAQQINLFRTFTGLPPAGVPLSDYTTGIKITHRYSPTGSSYTNYNWEIAADQSRLHFYYGNTNKTHMAIKSDGNIGIGTIHPTYKLHVVNEDNLAGTAFRADATNGHIRLFETDGSNPTVNFTQIERNADAFHIYQNDGTAYQQVLTAKMDGTVGLGTTSPLAGLHILNDEDNSVMIQTTGVNNADLVFQSGTNQADILVKNASGSLRSLLRFNEDADGATLSFQNRIGGVTDEFLKITGKGVLYAKEIIVQATPFPDYVFNKDYQLMPITEVEEYIKNEGHLPNVPCANDVETNGLSLGDMQVIQMEKIEELTLYIIQLEKKLQEQATQIETVLNKKQ